MTTDLTNQRFGRLIAVRYMGAGAWLCSCDCGKTNLVQTHNLKSGNTRSCGCGQLDGIRASARDPISKYSSPLVKQKQLKRHPQSRMALIRAREDLRLTRAELAEMIRVDRTVIFKVEVGLQDTGMGIMRRWIDALGPGATLDLFKSPPQNPTYKLPSQQHEPAA